MSFNTPRAPLHTNTTMHCWVGPYVTQGSICIRGQSMCVILAFTIILPHLELSGRHQVKIPSNLPHTEFLYYGLKTISSCMFSCPQCDHTIFFMCWRHVMSSKSMIASWLASSSPSLKRIRP